MLGGGEELGGIRKVESSVSGIIYAGQPRRVVEMDRKSLIAQVVIDGEILWSLPLYTDYRGCGLVWIVIPRVVIQPTD